VLAAQRTGPLSAVCGRARQTFAASSAGERPVWVVTERAVFRLRAGVGLELTEVRWCWADSHHLCCQHFPRILAKPPLLEQRAVVQLRY